MVFSTGMRKRGYLLLELMIALMLVMLCAVPLVRNPLKLLKGEISNLERAELQRIAQVHFAEIKAKLYQDEIKWELLTKDVPPNTAPADFEETVTIHLTKERKFRKKVYFGTLKEKEGKEKEELRLIKVKIGFERVENKKNKCMFEWLVFVKKGGTKKPEEKHA